MKTILAMALLGAGTAFASPGDFDPSFGQSGMAMLPAGAWANRVSEAAHVTTDGQGRVLATGSVPRPTDGPEGSVRVFARFLPDGTPDAGLAGTGYVDTLPDPYRSRSGLRAFPVADGKTLLVEQDQLLCWPPRPACALAYTMPFFFAQRIDTGGAIDPAYGVMATVSMDIVQQDVVASPEGSLTVVGHQYPPGTTSPYGDPIFDVRGVDPAGQLDTAWFGARPAFDCAGSPYPVPGNAKMTRQADGKFLIVQQVPRDPGPHVCVTRVNPDATLDTTYGTGGRLHLVDARLAGIGPPIIVALLARSGGGAMLFLKVPYLSDSRMYLAWLTADGALDASRGAGGIAGPVTSPVLDVQAVALQPDGKILLAGYPQLVAASKIPPPTPVDLTQPRIARLDANGVPDPTFGPTGEGYAPLVSLGRHLRPRHIHVGGANVVYVAGSVIDGGLANPLSPARFAVAKLEGDPRGNPAGSLWGSGCFSTRNAAVDPTLPALVLLAAALLFARPRRPR